MSATTAKGAKENLEQYTSVRQHQFGSCLYRCTQAPHTLAPTRLRALQGNRHTGSTGDYEMAKYIRSKALDFGIEDSQIKIDEFEILVNEPETLRIEVKDKTGNATVHDLMANYKTKKNTRMPVCCTLTHPLCSQMMR